jgi:hypothetical protein
MLTAEIQAQFAFQRSDVSRKYVVISERILLPALIQVRTGQVLVMCLLQNIISFVNGTAYCSLNALLKKIKKFHSGGYTMIELKNISSIWGLYYD